MKKSFESDENWFKMNRYGARQMMLWASVMMAFGIVGFFLPLRKNDVLTLALSLSPVLFVLVAAFQIHRYSKTL